MTGSRAVQSARGTRSGTSFAARLAIVLRRKHAVASTPAGPHANDSDLLGSNILDALPIEIAVLTGTGIIEFVNHAWRTVAEAGGANPDVNAFVGASYIEVCENAARAGSREAADARAGIAAVVNGAAPRYTAVYDMSHGGQERWFEIQAASRAGGGAIVTHTDVSARVRAERQAAERTEELVHISRALTAGTLSGAVTHELNQPLTAILANAQAALHMLDGREPDMPTLRETVRDTIRSVQRASEIVRRTRNLLTHSAPGREQIDINEVVQEAARTLSNEALLRGVRLTVLRALDLPHVIGDPIQLQQSVINLALNGFDAMADVLPAKRHLLVHTARAGRSSVEIVIEDRGRGVDPGRIEHIFAPFYTTKRNGMGMGLYITREIVRSHGGRITVKRNADRGMRFRIVLPSAAGTAGLTSGASSS